jgi:hypothetical protein
MTIGGVDGVPVQGAPGSGPALGGGLGSSSPFCSARSPSTGSSLAGLAAGTTPQPTPTRSAEPSPRVRLPAVAAVQPVGGPGEQPGGPGR